MKHLFSAIWIIGAMLLGAAEPPPGTLFREAEDFKKIGPGWTVTPHVNSGYSGMPSGGKLVRGCWAEMGTLSDVFPVEKDGTYRILVRYIDLGTASLRSKIGFKVTVAQDGKTVAEKVFDDNEVSVRSTPEGKKKWGAGWAVFIWGELSCPLKQGEFTVSVSKMDKSNPTGLARNIDCIVITPDPVYMPHVNDFQKKTYVRIRAGEEQNVPMAIHGFGVWGMHFNVTKKGFFKGVYTGLKKEDYFSAGDVSPFFQINELANLGQTVRYSLDAVHGYGSPQENAHFTIDFSNTPDESGIFKSITRKGKGSGIVLLVKNEGEWTLENDIEESKRNLDRAQATKTAPGKRPVKFPVAVSLSLSQTSCDEVRRNELETIRILGASSLSFASPENARLALDNYGFAHVESNCFLFSNTNPKGCYGSPDAAGMERSIAKHVETLKKYNLAGQVTFISWMDEPGYGLKHVLECKSCIGRFPAYLKRQNLTPEELEIVSLDQARPLGDPSNPKLYYWTLRFYTDNLTNMYRIPTEILKKYLPEMSTGANFGTEIVDNMVGHGNDWFDIYNSGALTYGWTEDWLNLFGTYQLCAFQTAAMRMVTAPNNRQFGMYDILQGRSENEIRAKAFSHIGSGAKSLNFFAYGPHYASGDHSNRSVEALQAIRDISHTIGAYENTLLAAQPVRGDAAVLFSRTSDYWNYKNSVEGGNPFGVERSLLFLLLRHSGIRPDLLDEDRLSSELAKYPVLFAADSHIEAKNFEVIRDWVKQGGILYLGAGALSRDRYNAPLPPLVERGDLKLKKLTEKFLIQNLASMKPSEKVSFAGGTLPLILGKQNVSGAKILATADGGENVLSVASLGKGKIIACGFFPGFSYVKNAQRTAKKMPSCWTEYPEDGRNFMRLVLKETSAAPKITVSDYLVEPHLLEGPEGTLLVLANWSGAPRRVTVSVKGNYRKAEGLRSRISELKSENGVLTFQTELADSDIIALK